jgi:hypothetical protein
MGNSLLDLQVAFVCAVKTATSGEGVFHGQGSFAGAFHAPTRLKASEGIEAWACCGWGGSPSVWPSGTHRLAAHPWLVLMLVGLAPVRRPGRQRLSRMFDR